MVPLVDYMNNKDLEQTECFYDQERKGYVVKALRDIKEGEEIFNDFGIDESNHKLFIGCGVVKDSNQSNDVAITLDLHDDVKAVESKLDALDPFYYSQTFRVKANLNDQGTKDFLSFCRYIIFEPEDEDDETI